MPNFDANNPQTVADFVLKNLPRHTVLALATSNVDGSPWVVCVSLSYDKDVNIIWRSALSAEHSKNISRNNQVGICIFSQSAEVGDFGFYCKAVAHEMADESEIRQALEAKYKQKNLPVPPVSDFLGDSKLRLYKAVITEAWVNDDGHIKTPIDLKVFRERVKGVE